MPKRLFLAIAVLVAGAAIGAVNGLMVIVSRVPDVIVTLTTGFIWGGVALLILEKPGGGAPPEFLNLGTGASMTEWLSNSLILLVVALAAIWIPVSISKTGLRIYATGSDEIAAFRSGVNVKLARLLAYVLAGLFSAVGGVGSTMTTGIGSPRAGVLYTLSGLAAVVIGGVSLTGGRGGIVGPVIAAFVLTLIPADLIFLNIDPNFGQVIQGTLIVLVVMTGGLIASMRKAQITLRQLGAIRAHRAPQVLQLVSAQQFCCSRPPAPNVCRCRRTLEAGHSQSCMAVEYAPVRGAAWNSRRRSDHGHVDRRDRSVGRHVAMRSAFLMTTTALNSGAVPAVAIGLGLGLLVGAINGVGVALLGVQPLVMTLGTGLMTQGIIIVYVRGSWRRDRSCLISSMRLGPIVWAFIPFRLVFVAADSSARHGGAEANRLRPPSLRDRRQPRRLPPSRRPRVAALAHRLRRLCAPRVHRGIRPCRSHQFRRPQFGLDVPPAVHRGRHNWRHFDLWRPRRVFGTIIGALILTVLDGLLTLLDSPEPIKQILYGAIIFTLAAAYSRLTA